MWERGPFSIVLSIFYSLSMKKVLSTKERTHGRAARDLHNHTTHQNHSKTNATHSPVGRCVCVSVRPFDHGECVTRLTADWTTGSGFAKRRDQKKGQGKRDRASLLPHPPPSGEAATATTEIGSAPGLFPHQDISWTTTTAEAAAASATTTTCPLLSRFRSHHRFHRCWRRRRHTRSKRQRPNALRSLSTSPG